MKNNRSFLGLFLAVLVLLPGCLHVPRYTRQPFAVIKDDYAYKATQEHVNVEIKKCSKSDIYYLFDNRSNILNNEKVDVVYVSVCNLSNDSYVLAPKDIKLKQVPYSKIVKSMKKTCSGTRLVGGTAALTTGAAMISTFAVTPIMVPSIWVYLGIVIPVPLTALVMGTIGVITGIKSVVINRRIAKDIKVKTLHEKVVIKPGDCYEGVIFVAASDYNPQFSMTMHENDTSKAVTFDVDLRKN